MLDPRQSLALVVEADIGNASGRLERVTLKEAQGTQLHVGSVPAEQNDITARLGRLTHPVLHSNPYHTLLAGVEATIE